MFWSSPSPWKNALSTALFYAAFVGAIAVTNKFSPSGMCNPGYGLLLALLLPVCTVVLLFKTFLQWRVWQQPKQLSFALHLVVLLGVGAVAVAVLAR